MGKAFTVLTIRYAVSRATGTDGHPMLTIRDDETGVRYRTIGHGYDQLGTVLGEWLEDRYPSRIARLAGRAELVYERGGHTHNPRPDSLTGVAFVAGENRVSLDGACGIDSMSAVAAAIGISLKFLHTPKGHRHSIVVTDNRS